MTRKTILLVEDNEDDVFFMLRAIQASGIVHPVQVVSHGQAAIDYLTGIGPFSNRDDYPLPFLLFLDLKMPHKSGLQVLEWIRLEPRFQTMLVLILTTSKEDSDVHRAYRLGANSFLVKPPNSQQLTDLVRLVKAYWLDNPQLAIPG